MDKLFCIKHRDWLGRPTFKVGCYEVTWHKDRKRPFTILKREDWYTTRAVFADMFSDYAPQFESFIQACIWLKKHHTELL